MIRILGGLAMADQTAVKIAIQEILGSREAAATPCHSPAKPVT